MDNWDTFMIQYVSSIGKWYNKREHEGIGTVPSGTYSSFSHRVEEEKLWEVFASEQKGLQGCNHKPMGVPPEYIGQYVWLRIFAGLVKLRYVLVWTTRSSHLLNSMIRWGGLALSQLGNFGFNGTEKAL